MFKSALTVATGFKRLIGVYNQKRAVYDNPASQIQVLAQAPAARSAKGGIA
ncbi:hypothetical protein [Burkholderia sp. Ac-20365]|uniref:hypothetical protein n=1 Tax=Burkholderia sp. Ac-20365 TaxID=2703897 RepID=UPI00197C1247|nr:hypothetical protein [Burkholderia sp. Ac-20365]MBN3761140.1 hypothetical protein [Burkholderia sp. Ac-20365]